MRISATVEVHCQGIGPSRATNIQRFKSHMEGLPLSRSGAQALRGGLGGLFVRQVRPAKTLPWRFRKSLLDLRPFAAGAPLPLRAALTGNPPAAWLRHGDPNMIERHGGTCPKLACLGSFCAAPWPPLDFEDAVKLVSTHAGAHVASAHLNSCRRPKVSSVRRCFSSGSQYYLKDSVKQQPKENPVPQMKRPVAMKRAGK